MQGPSLGFIGLGTMGGGMCANLVRKSGRKVLAYDPSAHALNRLVEVGAIPAAGVVEVAEADVVFLSLPSINEVETVVAELLTAATPPRIIVDHSTSDVARTKALAEQAAASGVTLVDAPVARTREAAANGTLLLTVGCDPELLDELRPLFRCVGSDIVHAGPTGNGQLLKILNNMVVQMNVNALAEALAIGRRWGLSADALFGALALGSADSFILHKTAWPTMAADEFPEQAFPVNYAIKDLALALELAETAEIEVAGARQTMSLLERARDAGLGKKYFPIIVRLLEGRS